MTTVQVFRIPTADGAAVEVTVPGGLSDARWSCSGCGHGGGGFSELGMLAAAGTHASGCGRGTVNGRLEQAIADARGELVRVDGKAATLLTLAGVAGSVGLAVLGQAGLPGPAVIAGWLAVLLVGAGVALLATAVRPNLTGDHGLVRHARTEPAALLAELSRPAAQQAERAEQLAWLARATWRKYLRVRRAVDLLMAGLAATAATTALTLLA